MTKKCTCGAGDKAPAEEHRIDRGFKCPLRDDVAGSPNFNVRKAITREMNARNNSDLLRAFGAFR